MKYSNKDFAGQNLTSKTDMDNLIIQNSCFSTEVPHTQVFPSNMIGTTFIDCNLDNIQMPEGCTIVDCSNRFFQVQIDGQDWLVDRDTLEPIEPFNLKRAVQLGLNTDPNNIQAMEI